MTDTTPLTPSLQDNLAVLRDRFGVSADLVIREVRIAGYDAAVISIEGMVDRHIMADAMILPLLQLSGRFDTASALMDEIRVRVLGFVDLLEAHDFEQLTELIISGFGAVLIDGVASATLGGLQAFMIRSISEPSTEVTVRGSREGCTEALRVTISMVRRRLKTPQLTFEMLSVGSTGRTAVCLCYLRDRVSRPLLRQMRRRADLHSPDIPCRIHLIFQA